MITATTTTTTMIMIIVFLMKKITSTIMIIAMATTISTDTNIKMVCDFCQRTSVRFYYLFKF